MPEPTQPPSPSRRKLIKGLLTTAVIVTPVVGYGHGVEANNLELIRTSVPLQNWPKDAKPIRFGFLSDLHCDSEEALHRVDRAVQMLLAEKPDIVLLGGDFITHFADQWAPLAAKAVAPLTAAPLGAYATLGNHDWWSNGQELLTQNLEEIGVKMLRNSAAPLTADSSIWLVGVDDRTVDREDAAKALAGVPPAAMKILLVHEPDYADEAPNVFSMQFSGHSHGGQVRVFGHPIHTARYSWKYKQGLEMAQNHLVYTTRGVGMVAPQIRIDCRPEVTVVTLGLALSA